MATYVITEACVGVKDATCVDVCPVACIHTTPEAPQYYIDPEICIACEQCFIVCPVNAIYLETDLPEQFHHYLEINAEFFRGRKASVPPVSPEQADAIAARILAYAARAGLVIALAVVDGAGAPVVAAEAAGAPRDAAERALDKAYTAARLEVATHQLARGAERPAVKMPAGFDEARMVAEGGGYPLVNGNDLIGAIGVSGSGNPQVDLLCCQAGLAALRPHDG
jgi:ferredoxin